MRGIIQAIAFPIERDLFPATIGGTGAIEGLHMVHSGKLVTNIPFVLEHEKSAIVTAHGWSPDNGRTFAFFAKPVDLEILNPALIENEELLMKLATLAGSFIPTVHLGANNLKVREYYAVVRPENTAPERLLVR